MALVADIDAPEAPQVPTPPPEPELTPEAELALKKAKAVQAAWKSGYLAYKLYPYQKVLRQRFYDTPESVYVVKCSRRIGKSHWLVVTALEYAYSRPGSKIKYAAADAKAVVRIIKPLLEKILSDCPPGLSPKINWNLGEITFPNGSNLQIAGCDEEKKADALRGTDADLVIIDEAGYIPILKYVVQDILLPQLLTTRGKMLVASSPAKVIGHFFTTLYDKAFSKNASTKLTVWDAYEQGNPLLTPQVIEQMCEEVGGKESTAWRREFLAEDVTDTSVQVIPSWNPEAEAKIIQPVPSPPDYLDRYVSLDFGFKDGTGILFGYWDGAGAMLHIQDELLFFQKNSEHIAQAIRAKELELWGETPIYLRIADNNAQAVADLQQLHGLTFLATEKDDKELQVNNVDLLVRNRKLRIDPRCKMLITHLRTTIWNAQRTKYERNEHGHGDLLDALVYLVRNLHRHRVNGPAIITPSIETHRIPVKYQHKRLSKNAQTFRDFFFGDDQ